MDLKFKASPLLSDPAISHGFFTRQGGVSTGIYDSLNCGPGSSDDPAAITENRNRVSTCLTGKKRPINTLYQVHSSTIVLLDKPIPAGEKIEADGLITREQNLILGVLTADCAPVLFADPVGGIIAAAHAGWRGALDEIFENVVANMIHMGSSKENIRAVVGPVIGFESYEVGSGFKETFLQRREENQKYFKKKGSAKFLFDLERFCLDHLEEAGLTKISSLGFDTYTQEDEFFSFRRTTHRAEEDYGRQLSAICLTGLP